MSDVSSARAPGWAQWLFFGLMFLLANRPVVMTASRRSSLLADAESLDLAMQVIAELRAELATGGARHG